MLHGIRGIKYFVEQLGSICRTCFIKLPSYWNTLKNYADNSKKYKWVFPLSVSHFSPTFPSSSWLHVTNDDSFSAKNQMNQMIIKYCRHKSDIVVVFETVIMYLSLLSGPSPPRDQHNGDNEVRDNERSSAASAVTFFIILRPPHLTINTPGHQTSHDVLSQWSRGKLCK